MVKNNNNISVFYGPMFKLLVLVQPDCKDATNEYFSQYLINWSGFLNIRKLWKINCNKHNNKQVKREVNSNKN